MEEVLAGLHWTSCLVYLDDIIVFSQTIEDHLDKLQEVFSRIRDAGLKIKPTKCHLLQRSVHYLGQKCIRLANSIKQEGIEAVPWACFLLSMICASIFTACISTVHFDRKKQGVGLDRQMQ